MTSELPNVEWLLISTFELSDTAPEPGAEVKSPEATGFGEGEGEGEGERARAGGF